MSRDLRRSYREFPRLLAEDFLEEAIHHLVGALGGALVVHATRWAVGGLQREAMHSAAEIDELPIGARRVHFLLESGDVGRHALVVRAVEYQQRRLHRTDDLRRVRDFRLRAGTL